MATLNDVLAARTREGELYHRLDNDWVHCYACGHNCKIPAGALGVCKVRFNEGGRLMVPWGYAGGVQCDPIEKKPFFHVHPGALAYSFGMLGCDLHCGYCQNWVTSQALRDPHAVAPPLDVTPERLVRDAVERGAKILVSTYNEPLITSEWAVAIFKEARAAGLMTGFVSNGNGTPRRARISAALDRCLQSRPEELRRPALSRAGRPAAADSRHHQAAARHGHLARDRHAADSRLQRQRRRAEAPDRIRRRASPATSRGM